MRRAPCLSLVAALALWPAIAAARSPGDVRGVGANGRVVFTFDDGPSYATTPTLIEKLDRARVRAAFFVNGYRFAGEGEVPRRNRAVLAEMRRRGHIIGNHAYQHLRLGDLSPARQRWQILRNEEAILRVAGVRTRHFRPPFGKAGAAAREFAAERGYVKVMWNIEPRDHLVRSARKLADRILALVRERNGGIVLLHDNHAWSVEAFGLALEGFERENASRAAQGLPPFRVAEPEELLGPASAAQARR
ncbi:MAG: polysaccharide deacetylase family protein [Myxococcota bacterium]